MLDQSNYTNEIVEYIPVVGVMQNHCEIEVYVKSTGCVCVRVMEGSLVKTKGKR